MIGALCQGKMLAPYIFEGTTDTVRFNGWLEKCLIPEFKPGQTVIMDNYIIHKSKRTKELIEAAGCKILSLPPYSPDLNPIEQSWAQIKARFRNLVTNINDFNKALDSAFYPLL